MRCYYVLVHGKLDWQAPVVGDPEISQPPGFFCHRYVLASGEAEARRKAFQRVRANLKEWAVDGGPKLSLEAEEVSRAPIYKVLIPENRGHAFYEQE